MIFIDYLLKMWNKKSLQKDTAHMAPADKKRVS